MDWPYIENANNLIVDYHIVYATVCIYLFASRAGHVLGLDGVIANWRPVQSNPLLHALVA